ncbi:MAG: MarC family protein [Rhodospirillales bacterium]
MALLVAAFSSIRSAEPDGDPLVVLGLSALVGLLFHFAGPLSRRLGEAGMGVVTRVMGMVLCAIAMGMLAEGIKGLLPALAGG